MPPETASPRGIKRKANEQDQPEPPRRIRPLDQDVVNKIAAGEIIVAPVHALKELTENAVDAGSTSIEILVRDGGLKLLQITDNGHGIDREDMAILCERFTTSKLKAFEDLGSIATYGFRGEALASISHIAHLQVTTRTQASSSAWRAHYSAGKLISPKPGQGAEPKACAGRQGTQITVEDLFYNVPTRRRAFRSPSEEYAKILDLVGRYAVHCSHVAFSCKKYGDSSMGISIPVNASTLDRIRQLHGREAANELIQLNAANERWGFKADGWISNANYNVKRLVLLLFINHRAVESSAIKKAIEQTYSIFLPKGGHPFVYLSLEIDPQRVDVNVHPTKREVNFLNEDEIIEVICGEIRSALTKVDTSRTFITQTLLPAVKVPTISASSVNPPPVRSPLRPGTPAEPATSRKQSTQRTPATRPYENNLVRTDAKARKITSMLGPSQKPVSAQAPAGEENLNEGITEDPGMRTNADDDAMEYEYTDREQTLCRLASVKRLRASVRDSVHNELTETFNTHTFVGVVDEGRRIVAIQSGVRLLLVDYGLICNEYFYQLGLTDFGNFGTIRLNPPLALRELLQVAAASEKEIAVSTGEDDGTFDWAEVVDAVETQLLSSREMLAEYFSLEISADGDLLGLPLLVKGYMPCMAKLPRFLLRLGPHVDWTDEEACFHSFLSELASWYVPEQLPSPPTPAAKPSTDSQNPPATSAAMNSEGSSTQSQSEQQSTDQGEDPEITARRAALHSALENIFFPAFKSRLIATKGMLRGVIEVANLKGLYKVFERC